MHIGLIGYGSIAKSLIALLPAAQITVMVRPQNLAPLDSTQASHLGFVSGIDTLLGTRPDLIVECAGHSALTAYAQPVLQSGIDLIAASVGAFADAPLHARILQAARMSGANLILPTGAIGGLDLLAVLSSNGAVDVAYEGIKPPAAWKDSPANTLINLDSLTGRTAFFTGSGREAALQFPKNANVVAALALAGAGFDRMKVALVADPDARTNTHRYTVTSPACSYTMDIQNAAATGNAATSMTTVLSIAHEISSHRQKNPQVRS